MILNKVILNFLFFIYISVSTALLDSSSTQVNLNQRLSDKKCQLYMKLDETDNLPEIKTDTDDTSTLLPLPPLPELPPLPDYIAKNKEDNNNFEPFDPSIFDEIKPEIVGGVDVLSFEFPHMAALGYNVNNEKQFLCGGAVISEQYILTAAHCLYHRAYGEIKWIRFGAVKLNETLINDYSPKRLISHPKYLPPSVYHDIALIELNDTIKFDFYVKPACLHTQPTISSDLDLLATGWGLTQERGNFSNTLQKVTLELFSEEECTKSYKDMLATRRLRSGIDHLKQFCAGSHFSNKDTCQGDSGGPLQIELKENSTIYAIVGVTSFGKTCGLTNHPGVYIKVSEYVPWIESVVWPNEI